MIPILNNVLRSLDKAYPIVLKTNYIKIIRDIHHSRIEGIEMKKAGFAVGCLLVILWLMAHVSFAGGVEHPLGIGGRISYYTPKEDMLGDVKFELDGAPLVEYNLTWFPLQLLSLEFSAGYTTSDIEGDVLGVPLGADFEQFPLLLTGRVHWWNNSSNLTFYGGGGVGYYVQSIKLPATVPYIMPGLKVSADDSFGYHAAGGLEWFFTKRWALNLDLKYIWHKADFTLTLPGSTPVSDEFDLDTFAAFIGIKFYI
jgi:outer membrane protein W